MLLFIHKAKETVAIRGLLPWGDTKSNIRFYFFTFDAAKKHFSSLNMLLKRIGQHATCYNS